MRYQEHPASRQDPSAQYHQQQWGPQASVKQPQAPPGGPKPRRPSFDASDLGGINYQSGVVDAPVPAAYQHRV